MKQLKIAFIWHMHQPWYVWPGTGTAALPFARLHACASYFNMPWLLRQFDDTRVTFNLVPSLTEQLARYADGRLTDRWLELARPDPADLTAEERCTLLLQFGSGSSAAMTESSVRHGALLHKRGLGRNVERIERVAGRLTEAELRDIQVWTNLAWCGYGMQAESEVVRELIAKDRDFTEDDKRALLDEMRDFVGRVAPLYREVADAGKAELSASPYYHSILPLLCNMSDAERRIPRDRLPEVLWREPAEARRHLQRAREHHEQDFGAAPNGLWPSEGAVSDAALAEVEAAGFGWVASDEEVLAHSLDEDASGRPEPASLYRAYRVGDGELNILFRDHQLSDRIGFVYRDWEPADAADDMIERLREIAGSLPASNDEPVVCIALDGENPWGMYRDGGEAFLRELYGGLEAAQDLQTVTISDFLEQSPPTERLKSVFPGSWIGHSYSTWIGGEQHRRAWTLLRGALEAAQQVETAPQQAIEHLMIAEGSDWFWWYCAEQFTLDADLFDGIFREHVAQVYRELGQEPPAAVHDPIAQTSEWRFDRPAMGVAKVRIDGQVSSYFEWRTSALLRTGRMASAMRRSEFVVHEVRVGHDLQNLYLRIDTATEAVECLRECELRLVFNSDETREVTVRIGEDDAQRAVELSGDLSETVEVAVGRVVEVRVGLESLESRPGDTVGLAFEVLAEDRRLERWPEQDFVDVTLPTEDELTSQWLV